MADTQGRVAALRNDAPPIRRIESAPALAWLFAGLVALLVVYPFAELLKELTSLGELLAAAAAIPGLSAIAWNTVALSLGSVLLATVVAVGLAMCRASLSGAWGSLAQLVAITPLVIPPIAGVVGWAFLLSPQVGYVNQILRSLPFFSHLETGPFDVYSLPWIVIITGTYLIPYCFLFVQSGLSRIDPRLEDAARISGSGWWHVQFRIVLPLLRPSLVYGGIIVALLALGQFTAPLLLGRTLGIDVITTELYRLTASPPPDYPLATFLALPILMLAVAGVAVQRQLLADKTKFVMSGKGVGRDRQHRPLLMIPIAIYSLFVIVPPLSGLTLVALSPYWGSSISVSSLGSGAFRDVLSDPVVLSAIINSVAYSAAAMAASVILSVIAGLIAYRSPGGASRAIDYVVNLPIAIPAILFGMSILVSFGLGSAMALVRTVFGVSLYGSGALLVLAYVVLTLPHGTRLVMSGIAQTNPELEMAARVCGSTALGSTWRVLLPLLRRHLVSAAMLIFALSSHELAASALLVGPETQVMSTVLLGQWDTGTYPRVAALALIMVGIAICSLAFIAIFDRTKGTGLRGRLRRRTRA